MIPSFKQFAGRPVGAKTMSLILAPIVTATALHSASAATIYSTGFESATFANGSQLIGQDGWTGVPFLSPSAAVITNAVALTGLQSLRVRGVDMVNAVEVDPLAAVGSFRKPLNFDSAAAGLPIVRFQADVRLDGPVIGTGDFFSANIGARSADGGVGELSISSDGKIYGYDADANKIYTTPITLNAWHTLGILVDFSANTYQFSVDGTPSSAFPFDPSFTSDVLLRESLITYAFPDSGGSTRSSFTAYYDNMLTTAVPEPATVSLVTFGCLAMLNFRRRSTHY